MLDIDETGSVLDDLSEALPPEIFDRLNGGVILLPESKSDPDNPGLWIMGEYCVEPGGLGRYVAIYHGSFKKVCRGYSRGQAVKKLREVLHHELTHHLESLAGDRSLEYRDQLFVERFRQSRGHPEQEGENEKDT